VTVRLSPKDEWIEFFRNEKFICFPIPAYTKIADYRYRSEGKTNPNQKINEKENYAVLPTKEGKNAIIDFDNKEKYRKFAENVIKQGYTVIESPHGWHIPVKNFSSFATKMELFDYSFQQEKIIEIQGWLHYCIGVESQILDEDTGDVLKYQSRGSKKIWDAQGKDFHEFVDKFCKNCEVEPKKKNNPSGYKYLRDQFIDGEIPHEKQSNDYFFEAGKVCLTEGLTKNEALDRIRIVYNKWTKSKYFSNRPWSNIETKVNEVYEKNITVNLGRKKGGGGNIDRTKISNKLIETRKLFSDVETSDIFENKNGFLEKINKTLKKDLIVDLPEMEKADYDGILFKLESLAENMPETNKDLIVFPNGVFSHKAKTTIETDELADMGFRDYNYLPKSPKNEPKKYIKIMFDNIPKYQHPRIKAGLRAILQNHLDPKISVIHGLSGVGKSTGLTILVEILGDQYALTVELNQLLEDKFIKAKIIGKRLLVLQDLPKEWKDFTAIKTLTGETKKSERGFMKDMVTFDNKLKIWASGNYLAQIPDIEKNAMYTRRLSLLHNNRQEPYDEDPEIAEKIIKEESEKIVSWILNFSDEECQYEDRETVQKEWESIASPEIEYLNKNWQSSENETKKSVMSIVKECYDKTGENISITQMIKSLKGLGYAVKNNMIFYIESKPLDENNETID